MSHYEFGRLCLYNATVRDIFRVRKLRCQRKGFELLMAHALRHTHCDGWNLVVSNFDWISNICIYAMIICTTGNASLWVDFWHYIRAATNTLYLNYRVWYLVLSRTFPLSQQLLTDLHKRWVHQHPNTPVTGFEMGRIKIWWIPRNYSDRIVFMCWSEWNMPLFMPGFLPMRRYHNNQDTAHMASAGDQIEQQPGIE